MVGIGKCIEVTFSADNVKYYIRTGKKEKRYGVEYDIFCECKNPEELTPFDLWLIGEKYYNELVEKGMLREINSWRDIMK